MTVQCGFFDSVNKDRLYRADEMTRPYELLISNGVFATPAGTPSTYLQVMENASDDMTITVKAGRGIFKNKWLINDSDMILTIDTSEVVLNRIDSIIVKVDTSETVRAGTIEIKKGTPATTPIAPVMTRTEDVYEYRLADIYVGAGVTGIVQANITDQRGSADCPWITSLVQQVDTSTLLAQWQDAYNTFYEDSNQTFDDWFQSIKEIVATATLIRSFTSYYVTTIQDETVIPINISQFNSELDILQVYINGLMLVKDLDYTVDSIPATSITLTKPLDIGQTVAFVVYKSVDGSSAETIVGQVEELQNILDASKITNDTGGAKLSLVGGDLLDSFQALGRGFHTVLASDAVTSIPMAGQYFRCFGHITDPPYGWIIAIAGNGKAWINFATGSGAWVGWQELTNSTQVTDDAGSTKISVPSGSSLLNGFLSLGIGFHTGYGESGCTDVPQTYAYRFFGHRTAEEVGWIMALSTNGSVYSNYLFGGSWQGWRVQHEVLPERLYYSEEGVFPAEGVEITPTKPLRDCMHGWELVFTAFDDDTDTGRDVYMQTVHIPKRSYKGVTWNGESMCFSLVSVYTDSTDTITQCVKVFNIYPDRLVSSAFNAQGRNRGMVLRAIYEY